MAPLRTLAALALSVGTASAFAPASPLAVKNVARPETAVAAVFDEATSDWAAEYPQFSKFGWGPSVQAEKWNGRHAMFGWVVLCATAYAKGHNLIPDADMALDLKEWGTLATISGKSSITNERAIILIANVHAFMVGLASTIAPLPFGDKLLLEEGEADAQPYGVMPAFKLGITPEAEMFNGRLAMMGITAVIATSFFEGKPILDVVNEWVGGAYY